MPPRTQEEVCQYTSTLLGADHCIPVRSHQTPRPKTSVGVLCRSRERAGGSKPKDACHSPLAPLHVTKVLSKPHTHQARHNVIVLPNHTSPDNQDHCQLRERIQGYLIRQR